MAQEATRPQSIFVLNENVSGMNRFLFRELEKEYSLVVRDIPYSDPLRYWRALVTFHPRLPVWKRRFASAQMLYWVSSACFDRRSRRAVHIASENQRCNAALQIGAMYNGVSQLSGKPRLGFCSWNAYLSHQEWPAWFPCSHERDFLAFYERERNYYQSLDSILCTNQYVMRSLSRDYSLSIDKLVYIGYGANFEEVPASAKSYTSKLALFVGLDFERKGGPMVVEAFKRARQAVPNARLRIIGPAFLDDRFLANGIEHVPTVTNRDLLREHFIEADFFVMPSICEPFGLVFLEAMALKNACIGSRNDAMPEIIEDGRTGFLVDAKDVDGLASYMITLFSHPSVCRELGSAAYDRVRLHFTWDLCGKRVRAAFRDALGRQTTVERP